VLVVVPYTELHQATRAALDRYKAYCPVRYADVSYDARAYGRLLAEVWAQGETFCWIEHDIEIGPSTLYDFRACSYGYCAAPYPWTTDVGPAMGCVRFSAAFIAKYPYVALDALASGVSWRQIDIVFQRHILVGNKGEQPHVHAPVIHHNESKRLRPDANPEPLATLPGLTFPLSPEGG
jgi:hypothetical protein